MPLPSTPKPAFAPGRGKSGQYAKRHKYVYSEVQCTLPNSPWSNEPGKTSKQSTSSYPTSKNITSKQQAWKIVKLHETDTRPLSRKILKDTVRGITKPDIRRLARRGGVKRISAAIYDETRVVLRQRLELILSQLVTICSKSKELLLSKSGHAKERVTHANISQLT